MPAMQNSNAVALQLEKVRNKIPVLYERDDVLLSLIQKRGDVEKVSSRNMRIPLQINPGGKAGSYNADGGDLGRGSGSSYEYAQVSPVFFRFGLEITKLIEYATSSKEQALEKVVNKELANGLKQFRSWLDKLMQTAGQGVLGTISSVSGTILTMTTPPGAALVYVGQTVQVYDATLTTNRGSANVVAADPISTSQTITLDALPGGTIATDVIVHDGLSGASPVSLFGLKYHQSNASTGTWLGLNRATYATQLQTPRVNASSAALTATMGRLAINKVRKALGINALGKLIAYTAVEQEHAWENLGITASTIQKMTPQGSTDDLDLLFSGKKTISGIPITTSVNADQARIDFLDLSHWGRAVMKEIDFFTGLNNDQYIFPIAGASGGVSSSFVMYYDTAFQVFTDSPRSGSFIDTLARPTGY